MGRKSKALLVLGIPILWGLFLYGGTVRLPIMYDDLLHIRIVKELDWGSVWWPTDSFGFYRPLTFVPMMLIKDIWGYYPAWLLHGLNVGQHLLNIGLLVWLIIRLWAERWERALGVGLFFATFPFAYQAVAIYGHTVHLVTVGLMLGAIHSYITGMERGGKGWWMLCYGCYILALLSHETAVLLGPFIGLIRLQRLEKRSDWRSWWQEERPLLWITLFGILFVIGYQFLPVGGAVAESGAVSGWTVKALYLIQAAIYPFSRLAKLVPWRYEWAIFFVGVVVLLGGAVWAGRKWGNGRYFLLSWGWWGLASLLLWLTLPADYLLHGARLLYLGAVGVSFGWVGLLELIPERVRWGRRGLLLLIVIGNSWFVWQQMDAYQQFGTVVWGLGEKSRDVPEGEMIYLLNVPQWSAREENDFLIGSELTAMLGDYLFVEELLEENLRTDYIFRAGAMPELFDWPGQQYRLHAQHPWPIEPIDGKGIHLFAVNGSSGGLEVQQVGSIVPQKEVGEAVATFGIYQLMEMRYLCAQREDVWLRWQLLGDQPEGKSIFVQLLGADGGLVGQADGPLLGIRSDLVRVDEGWELWEVRHFAWEEGAVLLVGVYDYRTGERVSAVGRDGSALDDQAYYFEGCQE